VLDRTNFQPDLTLRNAIRHVLDINEQKHHPTIKKLVRFYYLRAIIVRPDMATFDKKPPSSLPPVLADQIMRVKTASENMKIPVPIDFMSSRENLREAVHCSSRNLSDIEGRGNSPSTLFAPCLSLKTAHVH
jgi:tRNA(Ile)-lysidine synthase